jgi:phosphodiesterase/alkaline phosphatase D-like protein
MQYSLTADVHYTAAHYFDPNKAAFQDFDPFWEFVSGPIPFLSPIECSAIMIECTRFVNERKMACGEFGAW